MRTLTKHAQLNDDASCETLCIPPRLNPALALTERYPAFRDMHQVHAHNRESRGIERTGYCPLVLLLSNRQACALIAQYA